MTKSELVKEGIDAINQISELEKSIPKDEDLEDAQKDFEEIREFVKVAAEGIFLELNSFLKSKSDNDTMH